MYVSLLIIKFNFDKICKKNKIKVKDHISSRPIYKKLLLNFLKFSKAYTL